jgi:AraC-like DNA-binding protein
MEMQFRQYPPHPLLGNHIEKIWLFSSSAPIPGNDLKLIVPTGRIKLIIPFRDVYTVQLNGSTHHTNGNRIALIGLTDVPVTVDVESNNPSGTIGIEFTAGGAYRFFGLNYRDIKNETIALTDLLGPAARRLEQQVAHAVTANEKVGLLQQFLLRLYRQGREDAVYDFCLDRIRATCGRVSIKALEQATGYSSRWLNMKFMEKAGTSPKNLAAILRFQQVYRALTTTGTAMADAKLFYDYYYDQSHFIKDFKRFTGMPPSKLAGMVNEFGRLYFRE